MPAEEDQPQPESPEKSPGNASQNQEQDESGDREIGQPGDMGGQPGVMLC